MAIMQKKYINLIGFCLIVAITFGVGLKLGQNSEAINVYSQSKKAPQVDQKFFSASAKSNQAVAILVMPKSYLPLLEKFKHRKIARAIKILPAQIGWDDGQMVAIPQKAILRSDGAPDSPIVNISHRSRMKAEKESTGTSKMARGAAFLFFVKGAVKNKLRYVAGPSATHKAGL